MTDPDRTFPGTWRIPAGVLLALGLALRIHTLDAGFWHDELVTFSMHARVPFSAIPVLNVDGGDHMLTHLLYHVSRSVFGPHEWAARLPDLAAGMLFLFLIGRFAWRISENRLVALAALAIAATSPVHVQHSQFARGYGLQVLLALWLLWIVWRSLEEPSWRRGWAEGAAGILAFCGTYNNLTWALYVAGLAVSAGAFGLVPAGAGPPLLRTRARRICTALGTGGALAFAASLPVLAQTVQTAAAVQGEADRWERLVSTYSDFGEVAMMGFPPWALAALLPALVFLRRERPRLLVLLAGPVLVPPLALAALGMGGSGRHLLFLYPPLVVLLARSLFWLACRAAGPFPSVRPAVVLGAAACLLTGIQIAYLETAYYSRWRSNDLKIVRREVQARLGPHDLLIINGPDSYFLLGYYLGGEIEHRMMDIIRDRRLDSVWYATRTLTESTGEHVVRPNWIPPNGIPIPEALEIGPVPYSGDTPFVSVSPDNVRLVCDWGIVRLYRLLPERIDRVGYGVDGSDREAALFPAEGPDGSLVPDPRRRMEGHASLRLRSPKDRIEYTIPPFLQVDAGPQDWWMTLAAVSRRDLLDLRFHRDADGRWSGLDGFRVNSVTGPLNHFSWEPRTQHILNPDWIPSCWLVPLPSGRLTLAETVTGREEGWFDGIQSYVVRFRGTGAPGPSREIRE